MSLASDFSAVNDEHVRLAVLRLLDEQPNYSANDSVLTQAVEAMGLACTRDQMRGHIQWLESMRLVTAQQTMATLLVATLTERGGDVAKGRSVISGVQRPSPRG